MEQSGIGSNAQLNYTLLIPSFLTSLFCHSFHPQGHLLSYIFFTQAEIINLEMGVPQNYNWVCSAFSKTRLKITVLEAV